MKKFFKYILVIVCLITALSFFSINKTYAEVNTTLELKSEQACFFVFVRVYENNRWFIYIYTEGGIFVAKVVEL